MPRITGHKPATAAAPKKHAEAPRAAAKKATPAKTGWAPKARGGERGTVTRPATPAPPKVSSGERG